MKLILTLALVLFAIQLKMAETVSTTASAATTAGATTAAVTTAAATTTAGATTAAAATTVAGTTAATTTLGSGSITLAANIFLMVSTAVMALKNS